ncbi:hypothetical protein LJU02_03170 [Corynebacterium pseudotuberculosis]|uniref:Secreted protein n=1 Tax=Corynebacterium pseudotuberculosis 258 TaxID=1168865 RepID=A0AAU8PI84_CORPS|nr:hypothetical protein [Corynebacterium pseudotuberculosis]AEQ06171.2 hypothetical protein CPCIP5297_03230 [Corynebacterium pseudotuberculosis CIP 52.97]AFB71951.2 hypothetical protein CP316_03210 [Corynebacterium pseudotuberculosis 316]AFK16259.2 hypothetical protein CP258_03230 [Corynebacterium pseudotuberculosis 258]AKS12958.1 Hypothetical protein CpE19_0618 [Corynebacterium pseudotuberculosis]AMN69658.1 hypothetical protein ATN02_03615 [Corynebacterium pseudotuberculosis]
MDSDSGAREYCAPYLPRWKYLPLVVSTAALVSLPLVSGEGPSGDSALASLGQPKASAAGIPRASLVFDTAEPLQSPGVDWLRDQVTYVNVRTGEHRGTAAERTARPALSLSKLYIADYVFEHGSRREQIKAVRMIQKSDDDIADELFDAYPECIDATARKYGLEATKTVGRWGYSYTSTYDVVHFIVQLLRENPESKVLSAMRSVANKASDGTVQDFGTYTLPGVKGTKLGWSNDAKLHSSVSFGSDFVVAAAVVGTQKDLTDLVQHQFLGK